MTNKDYLIAICAFEEFGPVRLKLMLSYFKNARKIWNASKKELSKIGIKEDTVLKFVEFRKTFDIQKYLHKLRNLSIQVLSIFDKNYPENLKGLDGAPYILYVKGKLRKYDARSIAIVGSRAMTSYGKEIAGRFANQLANFNITVVSGLALGVDAEAQKSALSGGGRTIAVLASGLDIVTPLTNKSLADELIKDRGALVSEYPLGHVPRAYDFPVRDRLISGLAKGVIVIEAKKKSGTFYTVKAALDQGRPVFAVPGPITSPSSEGTNYLIQNGAKLITDIKDVIEEMNLQTMVDREEVEKILPTDSNEEKLLRYLETEPIHLDELVRISGCQTGEISARLTIMEIKGMVKNLGGGIYRKI